MIDMTISLEMVISIIVQVIAIVIFIMSLKTAIAVIRADLDAYKTKTDESIRRLENKQDKHNNLIERMTKVEMKADSAHNRLDRMQ